MFPAFCLAAPLLLGAVTLQPDTVPAKGAQETILKLDAPSMVRLDARSGPGTSCEVVDQVRGPFAQSGAAGRRNCQLDMLLDQGSYKVRLHSAGKGKGNVALSAVAFPELNAPVTRLEEGRAADLQLPPGKQASYWVSANGKQALTLRVVGRTAGRVVLWRNGAWLEDVALQHTTIQPRPGQAVHEWWLDKVMEEGDYLVTVYGTDVASWTRGDETNDLTVQLGLPAAPAERGVSAVIPNHGLLGWRLPAGQAIAFLGLGTSPRLATTLSVSGLDDFGVGTTRSGDSCTVQPKALVPECSVRSAAQQAVLLVRGEPGTPVDVRWARWATDGVRRDGYLVLQDSSFTTRADRIVFRAPGTGSHHVATQDVPADRDSAPLGCGLEDLTTGKMVATDMVAVAPGKPFERAFNYNGGGETIWFEVTEWGRYRLFTGGERKNYCTVTRLDAKGNTLVAETRPDSGKCDITRMFEAGRYAIHLYGGSEGVERLHIAKEGFLFNSETTGDTNTKTSCAFTGVQLEGGREYRISFSRNGNAYARGLFVRALPLTLGEPLPLVLEPNEELRLPITPGRAVTVRTVGGVPLQCGLGSGAKVAGDGGQCAMPANTAPDMLVLKNPSNASITLMVARPEVAVTPPALKPYNPTPRPLPVLAAGKRLYFDFDREDSHSMVMEVAEAGLFHVTTEGLLATRCTMRTPTITQMADNTRGGRGRNCLVANYLRPGKYLLTVRTVGSSKGRSGVVMGRRAVKEMAGVTADGEAFFRAEAGDLIQQKLTVKKGARHTLSTTVQGASLSCRLDDTQGWPVIPVPAPCERSAYLSPGSYLWTQLPLTVESMRRTQLQRNRWAIVLKGNKPHTLPINTGFDAQLGKDGKDEFLFDVTAEADIDVELNNLMQGRLYSMADPKNPKPVEVIAPQGEDRAAPEEGGGYDEGEGEPPPTEYEGGDEGMGEGGDGEGGEGDGEGGEEVETYRPQARPVAPPRAVVQVQRGQRVHLAAGRYKLVTEHSRADVNIAYRIRLGSAVLLPGTSQDLNVPGTYTLRVPRNAVLRLKTEGATDVRCRVFSSTGALVAEATDLGADWNCGLAEPLAQGDYSLVLESQTLNPGITRLSLSLPKVEDIALPADGATVKVASNVVTVTVPPVTGDVVAELTFRGGAAFSCAVEDQAGALLFRQVDTKECAVLVRNATPVRVRLWTLEKSVALKTTVVTHAIAAWSGSVPAGGAARVTLKNAGRFKTAVGAHCLADAARGVLARCGPDASFTAGAHVVVTPGKDGAALPMTEDVGAAGGDERKLTLSARPYIQRVVTGRPAVQVHRVAVAHGERVGPGCQVTGGVRELQDSQCVAASGLGQDATVTAWAAQDGLAAAWSSVALAPPDKAVVARLGRQQVKFDGAVGRLTMPATAFRASLVLPPDGLAVQLAPNGSAQDLCVGTKSLSRCVLDGKGGEVFIHAPSDARAELTVLELATPVRAVTVQTLWEERLAAPGNIRVTLPAAEAARVVTVEGALACVVRLDDGVRVSSCSAPIPPQRGAVVDLDHAAGGVRVVVHGSAQLPRERMGTLAAGKPQALPPATAVSLSGAAVVDRTITLANEAVVHVMADRGVCALVVGQDVVESAGLDGCDLHRLMPAGTHRLVVRPFGREALSGTVAWTQEAAEALTDGVGAERWIAPGEVRFFRFETASDGRVGLGLQVPAETLECTIHDVRQAPLGVGCQQYIQLTKGTFVLSVRAPASTQPTWFKPVLLGLAGARMDVPDDYLRDFFARTGGGRP